MSEPPVRKPKNPGTALVLGFFISGLGHMYLGEWSRGIMVLIIAFVLGGVAFYFFDYFGWVIIVLYWIWQMIDCWQTWKKKYPAVAANFT
jgi:TM2 domain-containing membrane protein YozV